MKEASLFGILFWSEIHLKYPIWSQYQTENTHHPSGNLDKVVGWYCFLSFLNLFLRKINHIMLWKIKRYVVVFTITS